MQIHEEIPERIRICSTVGTTRHQTNIEISYHNIQDFDAIRETITQRYFQHPDNIQDFDAIGERYIFMIPDKYLQSPVES